MLYIFGGLPGTGKTELSRYLALSIEAMYLRIDTIEQQLRDSGYENIYDEGYQLAFSLALDNLRNGLSVVADSTNPVPQSREAWVTTAQRANSPYLEIEIICFDSIEHRRRVEGRTSDIANLVLPDWQSVDSREYHPWDSATIKLDTAGKEPLESKVELMQLLNLDYEKR